MNRFTLRVGAALTIVSATLAAGTCMQPARADDFYAGKQVRLIIGSAAGGGYDRYARLVGRHIGKYIAGNPTVVVSNMPGAGGANASSFIYTVAPKDGTVLGAVGAGTVLDRLIGDHRRIKFDPQKINYIGSANSEVFVCLVRSDSPWTDFKQVFAQEFLMGSSGGTTRDMPMLLNSVLGAKIKLVSGYTGTNGITLAIERGEVPGLCGMGWSSIKSQHPDWFEKKFVRVLLQEAVAGAPDLNAQNIPRSVDLADTPEKRAILELVYAQGVFTRPFMMAPEVPADRVKIVRDAFMKALADPDAKAEAQKQRLDIVAISGETLQGMVRKIYAMDPKLHDQARAALGYDK